MKFFLIIFIFLLSACDAFRQAPPAVAGSGIPVTDYNPSMPPPESLSEDETETKPTQAPPPLSNFGDVRCHSSQVSQFNVQVRNFLSTSFNPNQANYTIKCSHVPQWGGGFFIQGKVHFSGGKFDPQSYNQNLNFDPNSYLEIHIVDTSNRPVTGQGKPIKMHIDTYASSIQGQKPLSCFSR